MNKIPFILLALFCSVCASKNTWIIADEILTPESIGCSSYNFEDPQASECGPLRASVTESEFIDDGMLGMVYRSTYKNKKCAIKRAINTDDTIREIHLLKYLKDVPRIPRVLACEVYPDEVYFALNLYESDMHTKKARENFHRYNDFKNRLRIYEGLAETLHDIHSKGIVHSDIKPENVMSLNERYTSLHLIDFNSAFYLGEDFRAGTRGFQSFNFVNNPGTPTLQADDIWSLLLTIAEIELNSPIVANYLYKNCSTSFTTFCYSMMINQLKNLNDINYKMKVKIEGCPVTVADSFVSLLVNGLDKDPQKRPTASALVFGLNALLTDCLESTNKQSDKVSIENDSTVNRPMIIIDTNAEYFYPKNPNKIEAQLGTKQLANKFQEEDLLVNDEVPFSEFSFKKPDIYSKALNINDGQMFDFNDIDNQDDEYRHRTPRFYDQGLQTNPMTLKIQNSHPLLKNPFEAFKESQGHNIDLNDAESAISVQENSSIKRQPKNLKGPSHGIEPAPTQEDIKRMIDELEARGQQNASSSQSDFRVNQPSSLLISQQSISNSGQSQGNVRVRPNGPFMDKSDSKEMMQSSEIITKNKPIQSSNGQQLSDWSSRYQVNRILAEKNNIEVSNKSESLKDEGAKGNLKSPIAKVYL